ncbi:MAG: WD40 repeat domain-containing serine/threonine protein kinase [Planctomycetota bacterium]
MPPSECPRDEQLRAFAAGTLPPREIDSLISHVDKCLDCQARFDSIEQPPATPVTIAENLEKLKNRPPVNSTDTIARLLSPKRQDRVEATPDSRLPPKRIGPYSIIRRLAVGGMGTVFEAKHVNLGRAVALKLLGTGGSLSRQQADQVLREWRAHGRLSHPNIVAATDAGLIDGRPYLVTELIRGMDLSGLVAQSGPLFVAEACALVRDAALALDYAHQEGVAHLDIKPSNIMLDESGKVKVLDLGTARINNLSTEDTSHRDFGFESGEFGTLGFLAPERTRVTAVEESLHDHSRFLADVYSLGCTLHFLLTGDAPFGRLTRSDSSGPTTAELIRAHRKTTPPEIRFSENDQACSEERASVRTLVRAMLEKSPQDRPADMRSIAAALSPLAESADLRSIMLASESHASKASVTKTGQTIQLTDLVSTPRRHWLGQARSWVTLTMLIFIAAISWLYRSRHRTDASVTSEPSFTSEPSVAPELGQGASPPMVASDPNSLQRSQVLRQSQYKPRLQSGFLFRSQKLFASQFATDSSITTVGIKTTAPRHHPVQMRWSPKGDRLAVLSRVNQLRIYGWEDGRLSLQSITRGDEAESWINRFCWNPIEDSLILASERVLSLAQVLPDGNFTPQPQDFVTDQIESVHTLCDGNRVLIVITTPQQIIGWDPIQKKRVANFCPIGSQSFASSGNDSRYIVHTDTSMESWEASFRGSPDGASNRSTSKSRNGHSNWRFRKVFSKDLHYPTGIIRIQVSQDGSQTAVVRNRFVYLRRTSDLETLARVPIPEAKELPGTLVFGNRATSEQIELLIAQQNEIRRIKSRRIQTDTSKAESKPTTGNWQTSELRTTIHGEQLRHAILAMHPHQDCVAVAMPGGLEIWNSDLQTVERLPSTRPIYDAVPLQTQDGSVVVRRDGGGIVLGSDGIPIGSSLPPLDPKTYGYGNVPFHCIVPPDLLLSQSTTESEQEPFLRNLTDFGVPNLGISPLGGDDALTQNKELVTVIPKRLFVNRINGEQEKQPSPNERPVSLPDPSSINYVAHFQLSSDSKNYPPVIQTRMVSSGRRNRNAFASKARQLVTCDGRGRYQIYAADHLAGPSIASGQLEGLESGISITVDSEARYLYATSYGRAFVTIVGVNLRSGKEIWRVKSRELVGSTTPTLLDKNRLLVTNWTRWLLLDTSTGESRQDPSPRYQVGVRHDSSRGNPWDGSFQSWYRGREVQPLTHWSPDLSMRWLAFATGAGGWVVLTTDGEILSQVMPNDSFVTRWTKRSSEDYQSASWAPEAKRRPLPSPAASLSIVRQHSDGRVTVRPVE